jgi:glycosyltransferase involved in cell wall biosynthesis
MASIPPSFFQFSRFGSILRIGFNIDSFKAIELDGDIIPHGGVGLYLQELLRALLALESTHEYYLIRNKPGPFPLRHPRVHSFVFPYRMLHYGIRHSGLWRDWVARRHGLDLLHEHHPDQPALRLARIPFVVTVHDLIPIIFPAKFPVRFYLIFRLYSRRNFQNAAAIISVSDHTKQDLRHYFPGLDRKVTVIPIAGQTFVGCESPAASSVKQLGLRSPYILNVSTVEPRKNHLALFDAFAKIKRKGYPHQLVCIGAMGWKTGEILEHSALKNYPEDILLLGQVDRVTLRQIYSGADLMVYPSLYEGFGLPPLEAMEFGVPVIVSRNSSLPEVLGQAARYLSASPDGNEVALAIEEVWEDAGRRQEMAHLSREQWQRFSWRKTAEETLKLYEAIHAQERMS